MSGLRQRLARLEALGGQRRGPQDTDPQETQRYLASLAPGHALVHSGGRPYVVFTGVPRTPTEPLNP